MWLPMVLVMAGSPVTGTAGLQLGAGLTYADCQVLYDSGAQWYYNWDAVGNGCQVEFVPMHYQFAGWPGVEYPPAYMQVFNEADYVPQGRIAPEQAAQEWRYAEVEFPGTQLVGPSISPEGQPWLDDWYAAYQHLYGQAPRLDVAATHCYFPTWQECRDWIETQWQWFSARGAQSLWLTELSFLPCWYEQGEAETIRQGELLLEWLHTQPYVKRVAWFATHVASQGVWWPDGCQTPLWDTRELTRIGQWWAEQEDDS